MANIQVLDQNTINKIAAGEVIERPASVVKELLENAIDAKATAVTVEIREGGIGMIRVTDNGCGIPEQEIPLAFLRHATSKIRRAEDLFSISSLGFRGEALASIAAVSQVELITKTRDSLIGFRYQLENGKEQGPEEIGAPEGTTFISRNLFFNTPARKKFLRRPLTEGSYVADLVEHMALSRPDLSIRLIQNGQNKLYTSGNSNLRDLVYGVYGREMAANLLPVEFQEENVRIHGFIGKPLISRGNRGFENYFVNGRYVKSGIISKAMEEAFKPYIMQHKYPFTLLHFTITPGFLDVNVHPTKMELRFSDGEKIYRATYQAVSRTLAHKELIPSVSLSDRQEPSFENPGKKAAVVPEPFEAGRMREIQKKEQQKAQDLEGKKGSSIDYRLLKPEKKETAWGLLRESAGNSMVQAGEGGSQSAEDSLPASPEQMELFKDKFLDPVSRNRHKLIGQVFDTYWLVEYDNQLIIIDQHAAHEKILYERTMRSLQTREFDTQMVAPPIILTLSMNQELLLKKYIDYFARLGFEIEHFGGREYAVHGVPSNLLSITKKELLLELIDNLSDDSSLHNPDIICERVASISCKAAVKGNYSMSPQEASQLIDQLLMLENPYHCPHGRPVIISMSKHELEKKFKRIV